MRYAALFITLLCLSASALATSYYVNQSGYGGYPVGINSNNGTSPGTSFATLQKAFNGVAPGDTIYVMGTFRPDLLATPDQQSLKNSGTAVAPITLTGFDGSSAIEMQTTINASWTAVDTAYGSTYYTDINYLNINGLKFIGGSIEIRGNNITIENNDFAEAASGRRPNFTIYGGSFNITFRNNRFQYNPNPSYTPNAAGINIVQDLSRGRPTNNVLIEDNFIEGAETAIWVDASNVTIRKNKIKSSINHSLFMGVNAISDWQVYGNVFFDPVLFSDVTEIWIYNGLVTNAKIYNNTFYNMTGQTANGACGSVGFEVYNNIFYGTPASAILMYKITRGAPNPCPLSNYNIFYRSTTPPVIRINEPGQLYVAELPPIVLQTIFADTGQEQNSKGVDPLFMDSASDNFQLQSASPAIDSGDPAKPCGSIGYSTGRCDIGAIEFSGSSPPTNSPPSANAGADSSGTIGQNIAFNGNASDDALVNSLDWSISPTTGCTLSQGNFSPRTSASRIATINCSIAGNYIATLTATDNGTPQLSASDSAAISITIVPISLPSISNIQVTNLTGNNATISWDTNVNATAEVEYGTTNSYGFSQSAATTGTTHSVTITGLNPGTSYHFRAKSQSV